jgi:hypothetical protein
MQHRQPGATALERAEPQASLTGFRQRIATLLSEERDAARRDIIVLALDGIPLALARQCWPRARLSRMDSVFPSTSSTAWLSSLTGMSVDEHGIPGVVFRLDASSPINVYAHRRPLGVPDRGNLFSDAAAAGYRAVAVSADLEAAPGPWLDTLLRHADRIEGYRFYADVPAPTPERTIETLRGAVASQRKADGMPRLIWCFVELDRYIHMHGYDAQTLRVLALIDALAADWVQSGAVVVAHSDHGLVPTRHDPEIEAMLLACARDFACDSGGAGRTRWFYPQGRDEERMLACLETRFAGIARACHADTLFDVAGSAFPRVGPVVLIAEGDVFATFDGHRFDHGSCTETEMQVPYARWGID